MNNNQPSVNISALAVDRLTLAVKKHSSTLCKGGIIGLTTLMTLGMSSSAMATFDIIAGSVDDSPTPINNNYYLDKVNSSDYSDNSSSDNSDYYIADSSSIPNSDNSGYYMDDSSSTPSNDNGYYMTDSSSIPSADTSSYETNDSYNNETVSIPNTSSGYFFDANTALPTGGDYSFTGFDTDDYNSYEPSNPYERYRSYDSNLFEMYPEYGELSEQISSLSPETVINFSKRYPKTVLGEKLVADFAENKARTYDYSAVQQVTPYITNADKSESCAIAIGDSQQGNSHRLQKQKAKTWLNTLKQPSLCDQFATTLNNTNFVNNSDRLNRLYRMLRKGNISDIVSLANSLGISLEYSDFQNLQFNQSEFFTNFSQQASSQNNQLLYLYAIGQMTDDSYREALMQLEYDIAQDNARSQRLLSEQTRRMAYRTIAVKRMNMNTTDGFDREVMGWFRKSLGEPFNFEEAEDYAMAGIRFGQWQDVVTAIDNMDTTKRKQDIWRYWLARAYEQLGKRSKAKSLYRKVAKKNNYYGYLAKDKLGKPINFSAMKAGNLPRITQSQRDSMLQNETFARAFTLYQNGETREAKREYNWGVRQALNDKDFKLLLAAARHANDMGWYGRSIYAMEKANEELNKFDLNVSYPMPRKDTVISYANSAGIDPAWAYGIMRQESRFNPTARSHVGAGGLMQIMPATAKYIARNLGESYSASDANSGDTNIRYGTWYMGDILNKLDNQPVLATAGYNAGPNRARRWQPDFNSISADQYIESIPFPETRDYVKHVMENSTVYGYLLGRPQKITQRIGTIYPEQ